MTDLEDRIVRFENMVVADPSNDMAHFSLGSAYFDAQRYEEAATSFNRCIALNPDMTRAMELGGSAYLKIKKIDAAQALLQQGYTQAASRGEKRVQDGIEELLNEANLEIPKLNSEGNTIASGKPLAEAPLPGEIGRWILENVDEARWHLWIGQGTKVINELRLDFSREEDQKSYAQVSLYHQGIVLRVA